MPAERELMRPIQEALLSNCFGFQPRENSNWLSCCFCLVSLHIFKMASESDTIRFRRCCVPKCMTYAQFGLFKFPTSEFQRSAWLSACGMEAARPGDRVCSRHFQTSEFTSFGQYDRLKKHVVPSLFLPVMVRVTECCKIIWNWNTSSLKCAKLTVLDLMVKIIQKSGQELTIREKCNDKSASSPDIFATPSKHSISHLIKGRFNLNSTFVKG